MTIAGISATITVDIGVYWSPNHLQACKENELMEIVYNECLVFATVWPK